MAKRRNIDQEVYDLLGGYEVTTHLERTQFAELFAGLIRPETPPDVVDWTESNIDLSMDRDSAYKGKLKLRPW
jgi:hypothetical protein